MATGHGTGQSSNDEIESQDHVHNDDISQNGTTSEPNRLPEQMAALSTNCAAEEVEAYALSLQKQCRTLLSELEEYQAYLKHKHVENNVEVRHFKNAITSEMKLLDRVSFDGGNMYHLNPCILTFLIAGQSRSHVTQILACTAFDEFSILRGSLVNSKEQCINISLS